MSPKHPLSTAGIYIITCTVNGKIYIGSSVNIKRRWSQHVSDLKTRTHDNCYLQNAWNRHGEKAFKIDALELCDKSILVEREQFYLDTMKPFKSRGFNIAITAQKSQLGRPVTPEHRAKISAARKGHSVSEETRAKLSKAQKGVARHSEETKQKIGAASRGRKKSPETVEKMRIAQRNRSPERNLKISMALKGKMHLPKALEEMNKARKGVPLPLAQRAKIKASWKPVGYAIPKKWIVTSPDGIRIEIVNLAKFCREHGLDSATMNVVARGKMKSHKGWKCDRLDE